MNRIAEIVYHFTLELLLGLLVLFLFYIPNDSFPPIVSIFLICLTSMLFFTFLLLKFSEKGKWLFCLTVLPFIVLICSTLEMSLFTIGVIAFIIFWRGLSLQIGDAPYSETLLVLFSISLGLIVLSYSFFSHYPFSSEIVYLLLSQLLLVLIGRFIKNWSSIYEEKVGFLIFYSSLLAIVLFIGISISLLMKPIQFVFFGMLRTVTLLLAFVMTPLLSWFQGITLTDKQLEGSAAEMNGIEEYADSAKNYSYFFTEDIIFIGLFLLAITAVLYMIIRRKLNTPITEASYIPPVEISQRRFAKENHSLFRKRFVPPEDSIRKEIFEFERFANNYRYGRFPSETIEEWLQRLGLSETEQAIQIYERVRYGNGIYSNEEKRFFHSEIKKFKKHIRDRIQKEKKKG